MKKIVVAGATGMIGSHLCGRLHQLGYSIYVFTRNINKSKKEIPFAEGHFNWESGNEWKAALEGANAVINLAGAPVNVKPRNEANKKAIYDSRVKYTSELAEAINNAEKKPLVFICGSAVGYYGDNEDKILTEETPAGDDFLANLCADWEKAALKAEGTRVVNLRTGIVLSLEGGALKELLTPFKFYVGGPLGGGEQWWSWIHIEDVSRMIIWAMINSNVSGPLNLTAPKPVTNKYFVKMLGKVLQKPAFFNVPKFVLKIVLGEFANDIMTSSRAIPQKALQNGYEFLFEDPESALKDLLKNE